jgi:hypothetical protein
LGKKLIGKSITKRTPGSSSGPMPTQPNAITVRGSGEWMQWLETYAAKMRPRSTEIIALGFAKLAAQESFSEPLRRIRSYERLHRDHP